MTPKSCLTCIHLKGFGEPTVVTDAPWCEKLTRDSLVVNTVDFFTVLQPSKFYCSFHETRKEVKSGPRNTPLTFLGSR